MRNKQHVGSLGVQAIAGTHVVLLGINLPKTKCPGLLGFAIRRFDHNEGEVYWLGGYKTFASVEPHPANGVLYSTRQHPIQGFTWSDFSAKPDYDYTYEVVALRGSPANPQEAETCPVQIRTESLRGVIHHVHFNRGSAASQEYTRRFGDKSPRQVGQAAFDWLSRGAAEAIAEFIGRAENASWGLRVGAYEFTDPGVLKALKAAIGRKADVKILYHAKNDSQKTANEKAIASFGLGKYCAPRNAKGLTLSHNKIIILTKNGAAEAVLTGSTNFSVGGIYGHSNVVHICEDTDVAGRYLWLWEELSKNEPKSDDAPVLAASSPVPVGNAPEGATEIFSPRPDLAALDWYAERAKQANDALFMTFAFGMNKVFQDAYRSGKAKLRYALMEQMSGPTKTAAQKKANEAAIITLRKMEENKFAIGSFLGKGAFDHWLKERLSGLNVHVRYLHTKYMLVDPLSDDPLVVSGSANFSDASTTDNDENMLVIRGNTRVADIYLGEFMRLYNHFAFRDWLSSQTNPDEAKVSHLDEKDKWWKRYFGTSFASRQRVYFAG
ncbi:MAG TPA: phospholipase D-like domain-containing protein [Candidatus Angelobacter sp.]|nr:phospholipase D-like domain-containing protein [Candidatus Angelobacter sp.]